MSRKIEARLVKPAKFAHYVLRCGDKDAAVRWYETVLGMEVVHDNPFVTFMTYDDEHHRLALVQSDIQHERPEGAPGFDHVAYTLPTLDDLLSTYIRLKDAGILPVWPINHGPTTSMYYADPDGHRVEFQVENFETKEELQGYFRSDAFASNPIGVEFDPEELLTRYEAGEAIESLLERGAL